MLAPPLPPFALSFLPACGRQAGLDLESHSRVGDAETLARLWREFSMTKKKGNNSLF